MLVKLVMAVNTVTVSAATAGTFEYIDRGIDRYGFPIVCVIICFVYIYITNKNYREDFNNLHESHAQEVKALTSALNANTEVIHRLRDTLEDITWDIGNTIEEGDR